MTATPITLTGYVAGPPDIAATGDTALEIRFQLVHSPTDDAVDDATLPCVLDADSPRADAEAFFVPGAPIRVTGLLRLPEQPGGRIVLEVTDVEEDGEDEDVTDLTEQDLQLPVVASIVGGKCVLECTRADGTAVWHVIAPSNGTAVTAANATLIPWVIQHLATPRD